jgi:hypothetical protein
VMVMVIVKECLVTFRKIICAAVSLSRATCRLASSLSASSRSASSLSFSRRSSSRITLLRLAFRFINAACRSASTMPANIISDST